MIPKRIFSIWLNDNPVIPSLVQHCLNSQKKSGYETRLITLENCDRSSQYVQDAIAAKQWVKAADYLRLLHLYNEGGIYLDADIEIFESFDHLLDGTFLASEEFTKLITNSVIGSIAGNEILADAMKRMEKDFKGDDDKIFESGAEVFTHIVFPHKKDDGVKIIPSDFFFPYWWQTGEVRMTKDTVGYHHFLRSWKHDEVVLPAGWFDIHNQLLYKETLEMIPDGSTIVELGVCRGRSLCSVARTIIKKNLQVLAVDTFEGTINEGDAHADAKKVDWQFLFEWNLEQFGIRDRVQIVRGRTDEVYKQVADGSLGLVMIDADHSAEAVATDIKNWQPKLKPEGILCGDDWNWPSVREGITRSGLEVVPEWNFWFHKPVLDIPSKPLWSITLIARNEAKCLPRAIASLKEFQARGGEVCLVDTGSTDNTAQVARDAGWKVEEVGEKYLIEVTKEMVDEINVKFIIEGEEAILKEGGRIFDFGSARNHTANMASNNMVSMMDCDEDFTTLDINEINRRILQGYTQFEYQFVFSHLPDGTAGLKFRQSKMYDRTKMHWSGVIHECLQGSGRASLLPESVLLLEHFQNLETNRSGYLRGLAVDCFTHLENDRQSHYFGRELLWSGRPRSAIKELTRHTEMNRWPAEKAQSFIFIGEAYIQLKEYDKAVEAFHKAISVDSSRRCAYIHLADHFMRLNDPQRVLCYARAALEIPLSDYYANDIAHYQEVPYEMLYWAYAHLGRREEGKEAFNNAFVFKPDSPKYLCESINFYNWPTVSFVIPTLGRPEGLRRCVNSIEKLNYPKERIDICVLDELESTVPQKVKMGVERTRGEYVCYMANDTEMSPDSLKIAILSSMVRQKGLVAFHSEPLYPDEGNIAAHFVIRRDMIEKIGGEIFDTRFIHCGVDNLLWAKCKKMGEAYHEEKAVISHHHFSKGAEYDWIYKRGWEHRGTDMELLKEELSKL